MGDRRPARSSTPPPRRAGPPSPSAGDDTRGPAAALPVHGERCPELVEGDNAYCRKHKRQRKGTAMPRGLTPCLAAGCPDLVQGGGYCDQHAARLGARRRKPGPNPWRNPTWRRVAARYLRDAPAPASGPAAARPPCSSTIATARPARRARQQRREQPRGALLRAPRPPAPRAPPRRRRRARTEDVTLGCEGVYEAPGEVSAGPARKTGKIGGGAPG